MHKETCKGSKVFIPAKLERAAKRFNLTERERQTLALLAAGHPWKAIAGELGITVRTVRFHVENLVFKIGGSNSFSSLAKIFLD